MVIITPNYMPGISASILNFLYTTPNRNTLANGAGESEFSGVQRCQHLRKQPAQHVAHMVTH